MVSPALFSSASDDWATPQDLFDRLSTQYGPFHMDACASASNAKCRRFYTVEDDSLQQLWTGCVWMNPPYGKEIGAWIEKASTSVASGTAKRVVCLLPARTDTRWFHKFIVDGDTNRLRPNVTAVLFLAGRVKFGGSKNAAPFPSMVVVFG